MDRQNDERSNHVERFLDALDEMAGGETTPDELADALAVHPRTVVRMLDSLVARGWVTETSPGSRRFTLTPRVLSLAGKVLQQLDIVAVATPFVRALRDRTSESAHLVVPFGGSVVQLVDAPSFLPIAALTRFGERYPLHATAVGKAISAFAPDQAESAVTQKLARYTPRTFTTAVEFEQELARIRARGYAIDDQEQVLDSRCVAAPVWNGLGQLVAAIGISGPAVRVTLERIADYGPAVMQEADRLCRALGAVPEHGKDVWRNRPSEALPKR